MSSRIGLHYLGACSRWHSHMHLITVLSLHNADLGRFAPPTSDRSRPGRNLPATVTHWRYDENHQTALCWHGSTLFMIAGSQSAMVIRDRQAGNEWKEPEERMEYEQQLEGPRNADDSIGMIGPGAAEKCALAAPGATLERNWAEERKQGSCRRK